MWRYLTVLPPIGLLIELYLVKVIQGSTAVALIVELITAEAKKSTISSKSPRIKNNNAFRVTVKGY